MKIYGVTTRFYDDGKVTATIFKEQADNMPEGYYRETNTHDMYIDYFETIEEAEQFQEEALRA